MTYFFLWIIFSFLVGAAGGSRSIGFFGAFILSIIFSPIVGVIGVALSKHKEDKKPYTFNEEKYHQNRNRISEEEEQKAYINLKWMRDKGILSEDEFVKKRDELFRSLR